MIYYKKFLHVIVNEGKLKKLADNTDIQDNGKMKVKIKVADLPLIQFDWLVNCISGSRENCEMYEESLLSSILNDINIENYKVSHYTINGYDTVRVYNLKDNEIYILELEVIE